jgi:hypothetical protein
MISFDSATTSMTRILFVNSGLDSSSVNLAIEVQTGTRIAELKGVHITGEWDAKGTIRRFGEGRAIALDVLNPFIDGTPLAQAILGFTRKFGPLTVPFCPGATFRFSVAEWKRARQFLHFVWKNASSGLKRSPLTVPVDNAKGDQFRFRDGLPTFRTQSLSTYMAFEIAAVPTDRFKRCANFGYGCRAPYFFASDLRERYCSETCFHESNKRKKREWWDENRGRGKNGTQKTR